MLLACQTASAAVKPAAPQLNAGGFAQCLAQANPEFDLDGLQSRYRFHDADLLLPYLAVYSAVRLPGLVGLAQRLAQRRWSTAWNSRENALALTLLQDGVQTPETLFKDAARICGGGDIFCAALISHNVLRTLGRHAQAVTAKHDYNPTWFKSDQSFWLAQIPLIQKALISLRHDGGGDRWGEWYHFFGILAFATHEMAHTGNMGTTPFVVRMNAILNPLLTRGGVESAEKARLDIDAASVAWLYLTRRPLSSGLSCDLAASYVRLP